MLVRRKNAVTQIKAENLLFRTVMVFAFQHTHKFEKNLKTNIFAMSKSINKKSKRLFAL
jgi:hypothetical protein